MARGNSFVPIVLKLTKCDPTEPHEQCKDEGVLYSPSSRWVSQMGLRVPVTRTTVWGSNFLLLSRIRMVFVIIHQNPLLFKDKGPVSLTNKPTYKAEITNL